MRLRVDYIHLFQRYDSYWKMPHIVTDVKYVILFGIILFFLRFIRSVADVKGPSNLEN